MLKPPGPLAERNKVIARCDLTVLCSLCCATLAEMQIGQLGYYIDSRWVCCRGEMIDQQTKTSYMCVGMMKGAGWIWKER